MIIAPKREIWQEQPQYPVPLAGDSGVVGASVIIPTMPRIDLTAITTVPPKEETPYGIVYRGEASSSALKAPCSITAYPYTFVAVAYFRDVTSNTVLSSSCSLSTGACRIQIDVNAGSLRHIAVGSSTQVDSIAISANKWYGIVCVGDSATSRRTYACDLQAGAVKASSNTVSATFPATFTAFSVLSNLFDTQPNGTGWMNADCALAMWSATNPPDVQARALVANPFRVFAP